jgi:hypothetical protein
MNEKENLAELRGPYPLRQFFKLVKKTKTKSH